MLFGFWKIYSCTWKFVKPFSAEMWSDFHDLVLRLDKGTQLNKWDKKLHSLWVIFFIISVWQKYVRF